MIQVYSDLLYSSALFISTSSVYQTRLFGSIYVNAYISYLANQTVVFPADRAVEDVDCVLVHTPAQAVRGGTVVAALTARLRHRQTPLQPALILLCWHQLRRKEKKLWRAN